MVSSQIEKEGECMQQALHSYAASDHVRLAAASPALTLGDVSKNAQAVIDCILKADQVSADYLVLPELCLTGATLGSLTRQPLVLNAAQKALRDIVDTVKFTRVTAAVGLPYLLNGRVRSCVALIRGPRVYAILPSSCAKAPFGFLPEVDYDDGCEIALAPFPRVAVCFGSELFSRAKPHAGYTILMPSSLNATAGSFREIKRELAAYSARTGAAVAYASPNAGESTSSFVFDGLCAIAAGGEVLDANAAFGDETFLYADVDSGALFPFEPYVEQRHKSETYLSNDPAEADEELDRILSLQATALKRRLSFMNGKGFVIGVSGGADSALALLASCAAADMLHLSRDRVLGVSMPGFGNSERTKNNARALVEGLGCSFREIDIRAACERHFQDIGYDAASGRDAVFENAQARERTKILLSLSNMENLLDVGTGDLSEAALGWTTFGGDHLAQYGVNASIPKTVLRRVIERAQTRFPEVKDSLADILSTPVSPELWPLVEGKQEQQTERIVGPYELHDFFIYQMLVNKKSPHELYTLACNAFSFDSETVYKTLGVFLRRFFSQQFKRNCAPEAPGILLSIGPSMFTMPSDMTGAAWLKEYEKLGEQP
ncbi:MAG TPA: NAD(+) synthase [Clostridia bacterium]|nr:NAD(+) synthase [Clostridia bacterium]